MTQRVNSITVVLEEPIREDDCDNILVAIRMISHVLSADLDVADVTQFIAESRVKSELARKLMDVFYGDDK